MSYPVRNRKITNNCCETENKINILLTHGTKKNKSFHLRLKCRVSLYHTSLHAHTDLSHIGCDVTVTASPFIEISGSISLLAEKESEVTLTLLVQDPLSPENNPGVIRDNKEIGLKNTVE